MVLMLFGRSESAHVDGGGRTSSDQPKVGDGISTRSQPPSDGIRGAGSSPQLVRNINDLKAYDEICVFNHPNYLSGLVLLDLWRVSPGFNFQRVFVL